MLTLKGQADLSCWGLRQLVTINWGQSNYCSKNPRAIQNYAQSTLFSRNETMKPRWQHICLQHEREREREQMKLLSCVQLIVITWTVAYQASPSMGFSRQEYWSGLPFPCPGDLPNPGIEHRSPTLQADALPSEPPGNVFTTRFTNILDLLLRTTAWGKKKNLFKICLLTMHLVTQELWWKCIRMMVFSCLPTQHSFCNP